MLPRAALILPGLAVLTACASMPHVIESYYFPKAKTDLLITQTIGCNHSNGKYLIYSMADVTTATTYSADMRRYPTKKDRNKETADTGTIDYSKFSGPFNNADISLTFTRDGRLSGVNTTAAGQGSAVIKNIASLVSASVPIVYLASMVPPHRNKGVPSPRRPPPIQTKNVCGVISAHYKADKPKNDTKESTNKNKTTPVVTLTYHILLDYTIEHNHVPSSYKIEHGTNLGIKADPLVSTYGSGNSAASHLKILPTPESASIVNKLKDYGARLDFKVGIKPPNEYLLAPHWTIKSSTEKDRLPHLKLHKVLLADLQLSGPVTDLSKTGVVWSKRIPVPVREPYSLPLPPRVVFGKEKAVLRLTPWGAPSQLEYGENTGASGMFSSAGSVVSAIPTAARRAAILKSESDLIYQQQRRVACMANKSACK